MMEVGFKRVENSDVDYVSCPFYLVKLGELIIAHCDAPFIHSQ